MIYEACGIVIRPRGEVKFSKQVLLPALSKFLPKSCPAINWTERIKAKNLIVRTGSS
jgi:hypothetical protein